MELEVNMYLILLLGKMKVGKLPKPTLIRYLAIEQVMLNKESARSKTESTNSLVILHIDRTKKRY